MNTQKEKSSQEVTQNDPIERAIKGLIKVSLKNNNLVCPKCRKEYHSPIVIKTIREQAISNFAEKIKDKICEIEHHEGFISEQGLKEDCHCCKILVEIDKLTKEQSSGELANGAYREGYEAGKSEAISSFAEKIKEALCDRAFYTNQGSLVIAEYSVRETINKLLEEQSSGDKK